MNLNDLSYFYLRCRFACDSAVFSNIAAYFGLFSIAGTRHAVRTIEIACVVGGR